MIHLLASSNQNPWLGVGGNLHPAVVHFPIALLSVAALFEGLQILRKRPEPAPGTRMITMLAAVSACVASLLGWFLEEHSGTSGRTFDLHKWIGLGATAVAVAAAFLSIKAASCRGTLAAMRLALILGAALVGVTGYFGGELVFGENHVLAPLTKKTTAPPHHGFPALTGADEKKPLLTPGASKVSFEKEIAPIIKDMCFKCHGGEKVKGKLKLNTKALAMEGGQGGKSIIPGKASLSSFYTALVADPESDQYMPPPKEKARPTKEQIERVKKWIEEGADWPDGYEFTK
jgi:uncharacterized membrane protein